jgi:hypothetical protein
VHSSDDYHRRRWGRRAPSCHVPSSRSRPICRGWSLCSLKVGRAVPRRWAIRWRLPMEWMGMGLLASEEMKEWRLDVHGSTQIWGSY